MIDKVAGRVCAADWTDFSAAADIGETHSFGRHSTQ